MALSLCALPGCSRGPAPAAPAARVILISCDTLRPDHLGVYGYERDTSPHLDAFAKEAVVFDSAWSCAPHTGPALSSLLAGRLPDEIGVARGNRSLMPPEVVTFPELLRDAGVPTAAVVSNWALRHEQTDVGVQQGFQTYDDRMGEEEPNRPGHFERIAKDTTDAALAWVDGARGGASRFFLWVHYMDPHGPYTPPADYAARFDRPHPSEPPLPLGKGDKGHGRIPGYQALGDERRPGVYRDRYDAEIRYFDDELGRLLDGLRQRGLLDDALVIFTADHGESLGEHDYWFCHGENVFREEVHVPLIVRYPAGATRPAAARVEEPVTHLDLWPTVLGAFGLPAGVHRGATLFAERFPKERTIVSTLAEDGTPRRWLAIGDGRYRLVLHEGARWLFDWDADQGEAVDLSARRPELVRGLEERYRSFLAELPQGPAVKGAPMTMDDATRRAMQALGYTDGGDEGER